MIHDWLLQLRHRIGSALNCPHRLEAFNSRGDNTHCCEYFEAGSALWQIWVLTSAVFLTIPKQASRNSILHYILHVIHDWLGQKKLPGSLILLGIVQEGKVVATMGCVLAESFQAGFIFKVSWRLAQSRRGLLKIRGFQSIQFPCRDAVCSQYPAQVFKYQLGLQHTLSHTNRHSQPRQHHWERDSLNWNAVPSKIGCNLGRHICARFSVPST